MEGSKLNAVVTLRNEVSPWLSILQIVPDGWELREFKPGQYAALGLYGSASRCAIAEPERTATATEKLIQRPYSIASPAFHREFMEFYISLVPGGILSPRLFNLKIGDRIFLSQKTAGTFTFEGVPQDADIVLIANGAGLAPFASMLGTHLKASAGRRVALIHGVRHSWDLGYRSVFMAMQHLRTGFIYLPTVSRPEQEPVPWKGAVGRVQDVWKSDVIAGAWGRRPRPENTHIFLCGSPDMIESMIVTLVQEAFQEQTKANAGQVHAEKYWREKVVK